MAIIELTATIVSRGKHETIVADIVDRGEYLIPTDRRYYKGMQLYIKGIVSKLGKRPTVRPISVSFYED